MTPLLRITSTLPPQPLYDFLQTAAQRHLFIVGFVTAAFINASTRRDGSTLASRVVVACAGGVIAQIFACYIKKSSEFKLYAACKDFFRTAKSAEKTKIIGEADRLLKRFQSQAGSTYYQHIRKVKETLEKIPEVSFLKTYLEERIVGQPTAVEAVANAMLSYFMRLSGSRRPVGVFLFLGPTGVGKTELAKALGEFLSYSAALIRLDMSHFPHPADTSRLIGASPGYIGHFDGGQLTNPLLQSPCAVVLLDEIEKAHPNIRQFFLPVFDEAFIKDSRGRTVPCNQAIFIMTSNLYGDRIAQSFAQGKSSESILKELEADLTRALSPEFYARVTPILFRPLDDSMVDRLLDQFLAPLIETVRSSWNIEVVIEPSVKAYLKRKSNVAVLGGRALNCSIEREIKPGVAEVLSKPSGRRITISYTDRLTFHTDVALIPEAGGSEV